MKNKQRKGFTIVELVIVIAIIAILAAVLIPTFSNVIYKAKVSKDTQLIRNLNTALAADNQEHNTMHDAVLAAADFGYSLEKIDASATDNKILWDSVNDVFCYYNKDSKNTNKVEYIPDTQLKTPADQLKPVDFWMIANELPLEPKYSIYAGANWTESGSRTVATNLQEGFDVGENTNILNINYVGRKDGAPQNVVIRTNGGNLTVNAPADTVKHHGAVDDLNVTAVATADCYHEYGFVKMLSSFGSGTFVVHPGAVFHQTEEEVKAVLSGKDFDFSGALFAQHYFVNGECAGCGMADHEHIQGTVISDVHATCLTEGAFVYECSVCGNTISKTIPALGHEWSEWTTDKTNHSRTCSACNETESGEHTWENNTCTVCSKVYVNATSITIEPQNPSDNVKWYPGDSLNFSARVEPADATGTVEWKMKNVSSIGYFTVDNEGTVTCVEPTSLEKYLILQATITNSDGSKIIKEYTLPATTAYPRFSVKGATSQYLTYNVGNEIVFDLSPIIDMVSTFQFVSFKATNGSGAGEFTDGIFDPTTKTVTVKAISTSIMGTNSQKFKLTFLKNGEERSATAYSLLKVREKIYFGGTEFTGTMSKSMKINDTCKVTAPEFAARFGGKTIVWSTYENKTDIVTIDSEGNITAVGKGQCTIFGRITLDNGEVYTIKQNIRVS